MMASASAPSAPSTPWSMRAGLQVATELAAFVEDEALPGTGIEAERFWAGFAELATRFTPVNRQLLARRQELQARIDVWHRRHPGAGAAPDEFLREIGYLVEEPPPFTIGAVESDPEIAAVAGPQLVVPALNARFLLNGANARWGSLYDALYGTDALDGAPPPAGPVEPARAARVIAWAKALLDETVPLAAGSWADWRGGEPDLRDRTALVGRAGDNVLLRHNGLHLEIVIDRSHPIGQTDPAGIADVRLEAALTTIVDLEDSVAAVDAPDKVCAYRNWLGILRGDLTACFRKDGKTIRRNPAPDRTFRDRSGGEFTLPGRSLLLVRNVGHLMTTPAVLLEDGSQIPEGILDAAVTSLCGLHDLKGLGRLRNSRAGAIYIVKPKMHGPEECAFADSLFDAVEDLLGLARHTIRIGVMDEERRTSANLAACIREVKERIFFINTGFLDRTGDEIRTSTLAGPMARKRDIRSADAIAAYEDRNVQIGLACGFAGKAQIGKGMWTAPDRMHDMLSQKDAHPRSGASTAWVPSPTAATLHAVHYHRCNVAARQAARAAERVAPLARLLAPPIFGQAAWSPDEIRRELDENVQSILGYVVRWVDQGVGCSKVPDLDGTGLMEDRATLRISSQLLANWLLHGIVSSADIDAALERMAAEVDAQNVGDPEYRSLSREQGASYAFAAARALIFDGIDQPNGYTEPLLHRFRTEAKAQQWQARACSEASSSVPQHACIAG